MRRLTRPAVLLALSVAGCGGGDRPKLVTVTGKVPACIGERSALLRSSFAMKTYPHGDGAPPGSYRVTLSPELANRIRLPQYADPAKTPLRIDVPDAGVKDHTFEVK